MFYGSKHGGVKIYFVVYIWKKLRNKVIPKYFWGNKVNSLLEGIDGYGI
jgi:hypothetical protein